ncbi:unnamed protein product, partial [Meganyctiphanes norvegica]
KCGAVYLIAVVSEVTSTDDGAFSQKAKAGEKNCEEENLDLAWELEYTDKKVEPSLYIAQMGSIEAMGIKMGIRNKGSGRLAERSPIQVPEVMVYVTSSVYPFDNPDLVAAFNPQNRSLQESIEQNAAFLLSDGMWPWQYMMPMTTRLVGWE